MAKYRVGLTALIFLTACSQVVSEVEGTFVYRGETLRSVERTFDTGNGTFTKRYISKGSRRVSCSATDDADCRSALSEDRRGGDNR